MTIPGFRYIKIEKEKKYIPKTAEIYLVDPSYCPTTWPKDDRIDDDGWYEVRFRLRNCYEAYRTKEQFMDGVLEAIMREFPANFSELTITRFKSKSESVTWRFDESYPVTIKEGNWRYRPPYGPNVPKEHKEDNWRMVESIHKKYEEEEREYGDSNRSNRD